MKSEIRHSLFSLTQLPLPPSKLGQRLKMVAVVDPDVSRAAAILLQKRTTLTHSAYENTRVFPTIEEFIRKASPDERPSVIVVGCPPMFRGTTQARRNVEQQILKNFPGVPFFVEKPVATGPFSEVSEVFTIAKSIKESNVICSAG